MLLDMHDGSVNMNFSKTVALNTLSLSLTIPSDTVVPVVLAPIRIFCRYKSMQHVIVVPSYTFRERRAPSLT